MEVKEAAEETMGTLSYHKEGLREGEYKVREKGAPKSFLYPKRGDTVTVHFSIKLSEEGGPVDDTRDKGTPLSFRVGHAEVMQGLDEALMTMCLGEKVNLKIESQYAYGINGVHRLIPPDTDIIVSHLEIMSVNGVLPGRKFLLKHMRGEVGGGCILS